MPEVSYFSRKLYSDRLRTIGAGHQAVALALPGFHWRGVSRVPSSRSFLLASLAIQIPMEAVQKK
jgi:hypothetical protein